MATQFKEVLFGGKSGTPVDHADIAAIAADAGKYLQGKKLQAQGLRLPGLNDASKAVKTAQGELKKAKQSANVKELGFTPELLVRGGIDAKGDLSMSITGMLPPAKPGKPPLNYDKTVVIRKDWAGLEKELAADQNTVVNLTKDWNKVGQLLEQLAEKHQGDEAAMKADKAFIALIKAYRDGDDIINRAAAKQAQKFKAPELRASQADFGEMKSGTIVLAAHGSRADTPSGKIIGAKLGKKTPEEIVELLTGQADKKRNLSRDFNGTILLSGCFTAAGGIPPSDDYDYAPFAMKVWKLLKDKGITCKVSGLPGQARTDDAGDKSAVKPTEQKAYDAAKKEYTETLAAIRKLEGKLKEGDPKVKAAVQKKLNVLIPKLNKAHAEKESKVMHGLIMTFGLDPVR